MSARLSDLHAGGLCAAGEPEVPFMPLCFPAEIGGLHCWVAALWAVAALSTL